MNTEINLTRCFIIVDLHWQNLLWTFRGFVVRKILSKSCQWRSTIKHQQMKARGEICKETVAKNAKIKKNYNTLIINIHFITSF